MLAFRPDSSNRSVALTRALVLLVTGSLVLCGCAAVRQFPPDEVPGGSTGKAKVHTKNGYTYEFQRTQIEGDSLICSYSVVEEQLSEEDEIAYVDIERTTVLSVSDVDRIEIKKFDYFNSALIGAGAVLFAIYANSLADRDTDYTKTHYGPGDKGSGGIE